jgi:hypothetical protein
MSARQSPTSVLSLIQQAAPPLPLRGHTGRHFCARFAPPSVTSSIVSAAGEDGGSTVTTTGRLLATASEDTTARVWDVSTGRCVRVVSGHRAEVLRVAWSPCGGLFATTGADGRALLWKTGVERWTRAAELDHGEYPSWLFLCALTYRRLPPGWGRYFPPHRTRADVGPMSGYGGCGSAAAQAPLRRRSTDARSYRRPLTAVTCSPPATTQWCWHLLCLPIRTVAAPLALLTRWHCRCCCCCTGAVGHQHGAASRLVAIQRSVGGDAARWSRTQPRGHH